MRDLTQLNKVEQYLKDKNIPYEREDKEDKLVTIEVPDKHFPVYEQFEFHQICVPSRERRKWDVICHRGSYGAEQGLLEIMGTIVRPCGDSVEGWLTANDVIARIEEERKRSEAKKREKNKSVPEPYNGENNRQGSYVRLGMRERV